MVLLVSLCGFEPQLTNLEFIVYPPKLKNSKSHISYWFYIWVGGNIPTPNPLPFGQISSGHHGSGVSKRRVYSATK